MALAQLLSVDVSTWPASGSFRYIRDFLACRNGIGDFTPGGPNPGPGYEIVDEYYAQNENPLMAGDWVVFKSHGEAGTYPHYLKMIFGSLYHMMAASLHWDCDTHKADWGVTNRQSMYYLNHNGTYGSINHDNFQGVMSIHADLDECHIITQFNKSSYGGLGNAWQPFGRFKPDHLLYDGTTVQIERAIRPAANQVIPLPSWPGWARVGRKVYSWDTKTIHILTIIRVNRASQTITVDISHEKDAGSWLAEDLCVMATNSMFIRTMSVKKDSDLINATPGRLLDNAPYYDASIGMYPLYMQYYESNTDKPREGFDLHYGHLLATDIWTARYNQKEVRGRYALAKFGGNSRAPDRINTWTDPENGEVWRCYYCYSETPLMLRTNLSPTI